MGRAAAMSTVETVQGPIDAAEMGVTLIHEHVRFRDEAVAENWPGRYDAQAELDAALRALNAAKGHGVSFIVDPTAMWTLHQASVRRDRREHRVLHGIYTYDFLPHYFENRDADGGRAPSSRPRFSRPLADENVSPRACARAASTGPESYARWISATRTPSCCAAGTPSGWSSPRTTARRSTGSRPTSSNSSSPRRRSTTGRSWSCARAAMADGVTENVFVRNPARWLGR